MARKSLSLPSAVWQRADRRQQRPVAAARLAQQVGVHARAGEDARSRPREPRVVAGVLQRLPGALEEEALLRVDELGLARRDSRRRRRRTGRRPRARPAPGRSAGRRTSAGSVPAREQLLVGEDGDRLDARRAGCARTAPTVAGAREAAGHADDRDLHPVVWCRVRSAHPSPGAARAGVSGVPAPSASRWSDGSTSAGSAAAPRRCSRARSRWGAGTGRPWRARSGALRAAGRGPATSSSEWPPRSKKLSCTPTRSTPQHLLPDPASDPSRSGVRGGTYRLALRAARPGRGQRPAVHLAVGRQRQRRSSGTKAPGTMYSGRRRPQVPRSSRGPGVAARRRDRRRPPGAARPPGASSRTTTTASRTAGCVARAPPRSRPARCGSRAP